MLRLLILCRSISQVISETICHIGLVGSLVSLVPEFEQVTSAAYMSMSYVNVIIYMPMLHAECY